MPERDDLRALIRSRGLRATAPRVAVLAVLGGRGTPSSHPEVTAALANNGWDRSTLYRNLVDLAEVGILRRVDLGDRVWRYELASNEHHEDSVHPHFLCTECGEVECLDDVELRVFKGHAPASVSQGEVSIQLRGVCDDCAKTP